MVLEKSSTRYISLMLTQQCNLKCLYCYERFKSGREMSISLAKKIIRDSFAEVSGQHRYEAIEFSFMGGEPLLRFEAIREISEWCWEQQWPMKYIFFASTNGTLLTPEMKKWFLANRERIVLGVSLDGTIEMQSENRGDLAATIDVDFFVSTWPLQGIKATISRKTLPHLYEGVCFLHKSGFKTIYANLAYGMEWQTSDLATYKDQLLELADFYVKNRQYECCSLLNLDLAELVDFSFSVSKHCGCGEGTSLVDVDGTSYPCAVFSPVTMTSDFLKNMKDIDFSDYNAFTPDECKKCLLHRACPKCYGMTFLQTGKVNAFDDFKCSAFKIQVLANCYMQQKLLNTYSGEQKEKTLAALHLLNAIL